MFDVSDAPHLTLSLMGQTMYGQHLLLKCNLCPADLLKGASLLSQAAGRDSALACMFLGEIFSGLSMDWASLCALLCDKKQAVLLLEKGIAAEYNRKILIYPAREYAVDCKVLLERLKSEV